MLKGNKTISIDMKILEYFEKRYGDSINFSEYVELLMSKDLNIPLTPEEIERKEKIKQLEIEREKLVKKLFEHE